MGISKIIFCQSRNNIAAIVLLFTAGATTATLPAQAQSYSYLPWALGSTLFYNLRYLGYAGGNYGYNNSGYGSSMFGSANLLQRATRGYGGMGYNGYSPYGNPNFPNVNNGAQSNSNTPPDVVKYGNVPNQNQTSNISSVNGNYSNSNYPATNASPQNSGNQAQQPSDSLYPQTSSGFQPYNPATAIPGQPYNTAGQPLSNQQYQPYPNGAGQNGRQHGKVKNHKNKQSQSPTQSQAQPQSAPPFAAAASATSAAPFAMAFINNVNTEYNGDIRKALANPSSRAWAQSLGVSLKDNNFSISDERSGIIERVLKDNSLDAVSKLNTVKILLGN